MNIRMAAQTIRDSVSMDQILDLYGYKTRHGFMCCPFHGEKEPSLKVYDRTGGWHCFGCGKGGSVIDFVMEHESCDFKTAVIAIDKALGLDLADPTENPLEARREMRIQRWLDDFCQAVYAYCDALDNKIECDRKRALQKMQNIDDKRRAGRIMEITAAEWCDFLCWNDNDQYMEYQQEKIQKFKEEVAAWRRSQRRKKKTA